MRRFIRHPSNIPIEIESRGNAPANPHLTSNISLGGLAFRSDLKFSPGETVELRIPFVRPPFSATARIIWCRKAGSRYELGAEFLDRNDAFMARMVEQVCQIENYQKEVYRAEGRILTPDEAATEWIGKFAAHFPAIADPE